ncbi:hypothetical protein ABT034_24325 [Streptomyces sp. NPDC002773]|uniref:hypothetical protein n=1 Tax=Streptomyces sp. NPDC002773 TaxID=3154430 RepID=UPI00332D1DE1
MTEQTQTQTEAEAQTEPDAQAPVDAPVDAPTDAPADAPVEPKPEPPAPAAPKKSWRPLLRGIARWTAAVVVCGGVGAGAAMGITAMERSDVPGLATESDGRWEYPKLALPALPEGVPRPWTDGNPGEVHHADLRQLLLPAPTGAVVDPKLKGGWAGLDSYLALMPEKDRGEAKEFMAESAFRHVAARGWTTPDGTTTRIHLLRFTSVAFSEAYKDAVTRGVSQSSGLPLGVESAEIDMSTQNVEVPYLSVYSYLEEEPYGPQQTRWAYIQAGDTFGVVTQTRKGGALTVPFQQTVALQAQLLG